MNIVDLSSCWVTFNVQKICCQNKNRYRINCNYPCIKQATNKGSKLNYIKALGSYATWRNSKTSENLM